MIGSTIPNVPCPDYGRIEGADYIIVDSVFHEAQGVNDSLNTLRQIVSASPLPVIAMEIPIENVAYVLDYGVTGITLKTNGSDTMAMCEKIKKYREIIDTYYAEHLN